MTTYMCHLLDDKGRNLDVELEPINVVNQYSNASIVEAIAAAGIIGAHIHEEDLVIRGDSSFLHVSMKETGAPIVLLNRVPEPRKGGPLRNIAVEGPGAPTEERPGGCCGKCSGCGKH